MVGEDSSSRPITELLLRWRQGDGEALGELVPLVYDELCRLARREMRAERRDHTLQPTALVHEAYARLVDLRLPWQDRAHFFAMAVRQMRRVLVDHARERAAAKRGGGVVKLALSEAGGEAVAPPCDVTELDAALCRLEDQEARPGRVVELHYFGGLSYEEIAEVMAISPATVHRDLRFARAWLRRELDWRPTGGS